MRSELAKEILDAARRRMAADGPAQLSLRAVARDLDMAPSALYRYYDNRDALLTALILAAYRDLGHWALAADAAVVAVDRDDHGTRWLTTTRAIRRWGLEHPQEWGLIYGSPVPGYRAPEETVAAANLVTSSLTGILGAAWGAHRLGPPPWSAAGKPPAADRGAPVAPDLAADLPAGLGAPVALDLAADLPAGLGAPVALDLAADLVALKAMIGDVPDTTAVAAVVAWGYVLGAISLELFGHYDGAIDARDALWDAAMVVVAGMVGLQI